MKRYRTSRVVTAALGVLAAGALGFALWQTPRGVAQEQQPILEYPAFPPTPTIGPNPVPEAGLQSAPLAAASFDTADALAAWKVVDFEFVLDDSRSLWGVEEGRLTQQNTAAAGNPSIQETAALTGDPAWTDYTVQVSFYDQSNGTAGLVARYSGENPQTASYYRYRILKNEYEATPKQVLEKVEGGVATSLVEIAAPGFEPQQWHVLALRVTGNQVTVTLNGAVVAEAEDPQPLTAGQAGVYTRAMGGILFDDFTVVAP